MVAGVLGGLLVLEPSPLLDGIVQLRVAVAQLARIDEDLEPLGEPRIVAIDPCERRDLGRVTGHERRAHDVGLAQRLEQLLDQLAAAPAFLPADAVLLGERPQFVDRLARMDRAADLVRHGVDHPHPRPRLGEIERPRHGSPDHRRADRVACGLGDQQLADVHHVVPVAERLVELHHRELGVVAGRDALVAEDAADLVDPLHAADDQPLEVQLQRDPQVQLQVERVVMGA